jgi:hypothetical protein
MGRGETAALSASSVLKLKAEWQQEYEALKKRPQRGRYVYLYGDGLHLKAGDEQDKTALLVLLNASRVFMRHGPRLDGGVDERCRRKGCRSGAGSVEG